ncbi:4'-phosphopantetheinyl transferase family protein [Pelagibaculum spongiae]|uniref:4'-phosphopantetheinyl transferase domain-containing protein n=1 Tax=Pelagibaculum spongiae TaxID=2080658 RepID=A0A2V1H0V4_9GAMM|nr:4'-phosphopantetheinyl transferase superfamily protein [Pelagibaculum spongiae]PVZ71590.1 hypothetical protein DC094_00675 [Pelagibaculum spongiae]
MTIKHPLAFPIAFPITPTIFLLEQHSRLGQYLLQSSDQLLAPEQQQKLQRLASKPAQEFKISRLLIQLLFDHWFDAWQLAITDNGKPYLKQQLKQPSCGFNLSHSQQLIGLLVNPNGDCGLDIEWCNNKLDPFEIASTVFTGKETQQLEQSSDPLQLFFDLWVAKEARLKLIGKGFSQDPKSLEFNLDQPNFPDSQSTNSHFSDGHFSDNQNSNSDPLWLFQQHTTAKGQFHVAASGHTFKQAPNIYLLDLSSELQLQSTAVDLAARSIKKR